MRDTEAFVDMTEEAADARRDGRGIVALESTIIAHGMPYPQNLETARLLERTVRETGATPATIALIDGRIKIGLGDDDLSRLAEGEDVIKASRRDLGVAVARRMTAATTVAGTMICAYLGGIRVFATGGIGGVHRGGETSWDVSADLQELSHTPVAVVSAGAKAILDLRRTLEYLETMGVPVIGYRTDRFPAFYTQDSGYPVDYRLDDAAEIAAALAAGWRLGLEGGAVIANPVPEEHASPAEDIARAIDSALEDAERRDVSGKALTPFLLSRVGELTEGESLRTNIALAKNNATLAGTIATALAAG
ncbi:MAG: pseudouridine-5-phosphate glycosidase [Spirochaetes bacterium]|jgi:pseudouridine-5'-phosphate glycosidase|nr:pseudouridine-5-phosphate glycosidase [Spirochaetota bacterium]